MRKHRQDAKVDANQPDIVKDLRKLGFSVELDHDDILVGHRGLTFWYEIKNPDLACSKKTGEILESSIKDDQKRIRKEFKGHYKIVSSTEEIVNDIKSLTNT